MRDVFIAGIPSRPYRAPESTATPLAPTPPVRREGAPYGYRPALERDRWGQVTISRYEGFGKSKALLHHLNISPPPPTGTIPCHPSRPSVLVNVMPEVDVLYFMAEISGEGIGKFPTLRNQSLMITARGRFRTEQFP